ncbi:hypothetical protein PF70_01636 [Pseudomonas asplenii]|nr:hypothetical protein PF70_01636 [Pseudomonas fuscovaginae]
MLLGYASLAAFHVQCEVLPGLHRVVQYPDDLNDLIAGQPVEHDMPRLLYGANGRGSLPTDIGQVKAPQSFSEFIARAATRSVRCECKFFNGSA